METQHWLETLADYGHITSDQVMGLKSNLKEAGRVLSSMIEQSILFCRLTQYEARESDE